jgi:capsular polysaccharide biosynthesis protein
MRRARDPKAHQPQRRPVRRALREHWPYILASVLLAVLGALFYLTTADKPYESKAVVRVTPVPPVLGRSVVTAATVAAGPRVVHEVKQRLRLDAQNRELLSHVRFAPNAQDSTLTITGKAVSPRLAADIANAFAAALVAERSAEVHRELRATVARLSVRFESLRARGDSPEASRLAGQIAALRPFIGAQQPTLQVASRAVPPSHAAWPRPWVTIATALLAGLLFGVGIAVVLERLNPLVMAERDIFEPGRPPVLARVPQLTDGQLRNELIPTSMDAPAESTITYADLWTRLVERDPRRAPETILVTDAAPGKGSVAVGIGLAAVAALTGRRVVLVDAGTHDRAVSRLVTNLPTPRGLREVLFDGVPLDDVLVPAAHLSYLLRVLPAEADDEAYLGLLPPGRREALFDELRDAASVVVFVTSATSDVRTSLLLADAVDAVVLTVQLGRTRRDKVAAVLRDLRGRGIVPAGLVVVDRRTSSRGRAPVRFGRSRPASARPILPNV